jgi:predicted aspartyl protease
MRERGRCFSLVVICWFVAMTSQAIAELRSLNPTVSGQQTAGTGSVVRVSVRGNGRLVIPVSVNGKQECRFLFDTGATTTVIDEKLAARTGVDARSRESVYTFAGNVPMSAGRVEMLAIGNRGMAGMEVLVADLGPLFNLDADIDGILGEDVLSRFNYLLDRRGRNLEIEQESSLSPAPPGTKVSFERRGGKIYVPVAEGAVRLILDSGNPYLVVYEDAVPKLQTSVESANNGTGAVGSSSRHRAIRPCRIAELQIGDRLLRKVEALLSARDAGRWEDGFLPLHFFDSIYVNNAQNFLIANPRQDW